MFERFYKADSARTRSEGSGLGLAIAWENARLHGGALEAGQRTGRRRPVHAAATPARGATMIRRALALAVALAAAGCGIPATGPTSSGAAPSPAANGQQVYFVLNGALQPSLRQGGERRDGAAALALELLAKGPLPAERAAGFTSEIPADVQIFESTADTVILVSQNIGSSDPTRLSDAAAAQITCTAVAAHARVGDPVTPISLSDKAGRRRGPLTCPLLTSTVSRA